MRVYCLFLAVILFATSEAFYDSEDMEIYDLFGEVNGTFYELLGVENTATTAELRRAYRRRSKELHPDKNKAENAEEQFRQLVGVYEILKNSERREKYEHVLQYGVPRGAQIYGRYRKMGNLEVSIIVGLIATLGHYLAWWAAYLEKYYEMSEKLEPERRKRDRKRRRQTENEDDGPDELDVAYRLERDLDYRKPGRWDFLPFVLFRNSKYFVMSIPDRIRKKKEEKRLEEERLRREEEERKEAEEKAAQPKPKRVKQPKKIRDASEYDDDESWNVLGLQQDVDGEGKIVKKEIKKSEWTEDDYALLAKVMAKYPGGTPGRWERIAHDLGRTTSDITKKVKQMKESLAANNAVQQNPGSDKLVTKKLDINISDTIVTKAIGNELDKTSLFISNNTYESPDDIPDDFWEGTSAPEPEEDIYIPKKKTKVKTRPVDDKPKEAPENDDAAVPNENDNSQNKTVDKTTESQPETKPVEDLWTQIQQKCLESAIQQFPKSTSERWTCISRAVPGKTKEQCIARYKLIAEQILQRKSKQGKGS